MRVLTWNLFHGRSVPESPRALLPEFTDKIAGWDWDVALLQEVPPWWPGALARACEADARAVLTSRNFGLAARRWIAERRPDVIKSNGGGANAILVRRAFDAVERHAAERVRRRPERRWVHGVRLAGSGVWVANVHATANPKDKTRADMARCAAIVAGWAGDGGAALLGGDANVPDPDVPGFADLGGHRIDRFFGRGVTATAAPVVLDHAPLSDHAPVLIAVS